MDDDANKMKENIEPDTQQSIDSDKAAMEPVPTMQPSKPMNKNSKKPLILGLIIAGAVVVLGGGSALAYNMWYQNPDKVLSDTVSNLFSRDSLAGDGAMKVETKEFTSAVDVSHMIFDGEASLTVGVKVDAKEENMKFDFGGNAVYEKDGTVYIKVNNVQKLFDTLVEAQMKSEVSDMTADEKAMAMGMVQAMFGSVIKEIDGQWIKISPKDISEKEDSSSDMKCFAEASDILSNDKDARKELSDVYMDNKFMVVKDKLGSKDGNIGFVYNLDQDKVKDFEKAVKETKLGKKMAECGSEKSDKSDNAKTDDSELSDVSVEIWVDRWTHDLVSVSATADVEDGSMQLDYAPDYDTEAKAVEVPKDAITLDELSKRLGGLFDI